MINQKNMLKVFDVAKYFMYLANQGKKPITNKKLQKLVYYSQAWSLVLNNRKLFNEPIEAWIHGPAVRNLYIKYKSFGFNPINIDIKENSIKISTEDRELIDEVWKVYGKLDAQYLEMLTHSEQPWQEARSGLESFEGSDNEISTEDMKRFYSAKLEKTQNKQTHNE